MTRFVYPHEWTVENDPQREFVKNLSQLNRLCKTWYSTIPVVPDAERATNQFECMHVNTLTDWLSYNEHFAY